MLPKPTVTEEQVSDGKVEITWSVEDPDNETGFFHVIVYKMHKATAPESFVLAETDFSYIESTGTIRKHEERGAVWDYVPDMPGWYAKYPMYMNNAIGIDAFNYFMGSDNDDAFGGAYLLSPDYDLSMIADPRLKVECELAHEATSVTGGFALYTYSLDWWDPKNIDYKGVEGEDHHFTDLSDTWQAYSAECVPNEYLNRTRVAFYGSGYSTFWINKVKVTAPLSAGDQITYAASVHRVEGTSFSIDTTGDTENDFVYAYQVCGLKEEYDDYRQLTTIRFKSDFSDMKVIGEDLSSVSVAEADSMVRVRAHNGSITVTGASEAEIYDISGRMLFHGDATSPIELGTTGVFIVKAGGKTCKVVL